MRDRSTSPPEDSVRGHGGSLGICRLQPMRELFSLLFLLRVLSEVLLVFVPTLVYFLPHHCAVFP